MIFSKRVACGNFVKRQTSESGFSHFDGSWEELEFMTASILESNPEAVKPGYRDGVILVEFWGSHSRFYSGIVPIDMFSKLTANCSTRRIIETPYIRISTKAEKQQAKYASVVLYRHDVLAENNERETTAEWEIVCIKARVSEEEEPMDPYTMARNFLHLPGGTKGDFTAQQFAESIVYWNQHCMSAGKPKWYRKLVEWGRKIRDALFRLGLHEWHSLPDREKF